MHNGDDKLGVRSSTALAENTIHFLARQFQATTTL
jgi:hypothetical protein